MTTKTKPAETEDDKDVPELPLLARIMHAQTMQAHAIGQQMDEYNQAEIKRLTAEVKYWRGRFYAAQDRVMRLFDEPDKWEGGMA